MPTVCVTFWKSFKLWTSWTGAARRRQRLLRQFLLHESLSVTMALSEKKHRTSRGQRKDRAGEWVRDAPHGEVLEKHTAQEPGTRHFSLDVDDSVPDWRAGASGWGGRPAGSAVAVAYVANRAPLLVVGVPSLADSSAEAIDGRTLWYLLRKNLARQKMEEGQSWRRSWSSSSRRVVCSLVLPPRHARGGGRGRRGEREKVPKSSSRPSSSRPRKSGHFPTSPSSGSCSVSSCCLRSPGR